MKLDCKYLQNKYKRTCFPYIMLIEYPEQNPVRRTKMFSSNVDDFGDDGIWRVGNYLIEPKQIPIALFAQ